MKTLVTLLAIITLSLSAGEIYGQQASEDQKNDKQKEKLEQHEYYKKTLNADSELAEKVVQIQATYKEGVGAISEDPNLSEEVKRQKFQALIDDKNRKLETILTPAQQELVIPTTEREEKKEKKEKEAKTE